LHAEPEAVAEILSSLADGFRAADASPSPIATSPRRFRWRIVCARALLAD